MGVTPKQMSHVIYLFLKSCTEKWYDASTTMPTPWPMPWPGRGINDVVVAGVGNVATCNEISSVCVFYAWTRL